MYFKDVDGHLIQFYVDPGTNQLIYNIDGVSNPITSTKVSVTSFNLACDKNSSFSPAIIELNFTILYGTPQSDQNQTDILPITYRTRVVLRNN